LEDVDKLFEHRLPPNAAYACKPLDVGTNRSFKQALRCIFKDYLVNCTAKVDKGSLCVWIKQAWDSIEPSEIKTAFASCDFDHSLLNFEPLYWEKLHSPQQEIQADCNRNPVLQELARGSRIIIQVLFYVLINKMIIIMNVTG
jgi:hypothetical protein